MDKELSTIRHIHSERVGKGLDLNLHESPGLTRNVLSKCLLLGGVGGVFRLLGCVRSGSSRIEGCRAISGVSLFAFNFTERLGMSL